MGSQDMGFPGLQPGMMGSLPMGRAGGGGGGMGGVGGGGQGLGGLAGGGGLGGNNGGMQALQVGMQGLGMGLLPGTGGGMHVGSPGHAGASVWGSHGVVVTQPGVEAAFHGGHQQPNSAQQQVVMSAAPATTAAAAAAVFPVVRVRGIPFDCTENDVYDFFQGLEPLDVLICRHMGRLTGDAFVLFPGHMLVRIPSSPDLSLRPSDNSDHT
jgi:hypothetical protein